MLSNDLHNKQVEASQHKDLQAPDLLYGVHFDHGDLVKRLQQVVRETSPKHKVRGHTPQKKTVRVKVPKLQIAAPRGKSSLRLNALISPRSPRRTAALTQRLVSPVKSMLKSPRAVRSPQVVRSPRAVLNGLSSGVLRSPLLAQSLYSKLRAG
jgi:hypothetical protein